MCQLHNRKKKKKKKPREFVVVNLSALDGLVDFPTES